jgi:hypothetical protein
LNTALVVASADARLVELWLHGRCPNTQATYRAAAARFLAFDDEPIDDDSHEGDSVLR